MPSTCNCFLLKQCHFTPAILLLIKGTNHFLSLKNVRNLKCNATLSINIYSNMPRFPPEVAVDSNVFLTISDIQMPQRQMNAAPLPLSHNPYIINFCCCTNAGRQMPF